MYTDCDLMSYQMAEMLHMTPADVLDGHTAAEMIGWRLFFEWRESEHEKMEKDAERKQVASQSKQATVSQLRGG